MKKIIVGILVIFSLQSKSLAQESNTKISVYSGTIVAGYVDNGGYLNFTGPNINIEIKKSRIMFGMLPSLRFKEDKSIPKNSILTPTLGIGITYSYNSFAVQMPFYYNTKTSTTNGNWHVGIGIGIRLK